MAGFEMETLHELLVLWREGAYNSADGSGYSREFLAGTICADLGRRKRWVKAQRLDLADGVTMQEVEEKECMVQEAEEILASDPTLAESALEDTYPEGLVESLRDFVKPWKDGKVLDAEVRADEGHSLLFGYDSLSLILNVISMASLSKKAKRKLAKNKTVFAKATRLIRRNVLAFMPAAYMMNDYCANWEVEQKSVLHRVAYLAGGAELDILILAEACECEAERAKSKARCTLH